MALNICPSKENRHSFLIRQLFVTSNVTFEEEQFKVCPICKAKVEGNHKCKSKKNLLGRGKTLLPGSGSFLRTPSKQALMRIGTRNLLHV
jgi:hypothetical protein